MLLLLTLAASEQVHRAKVTAAVTQLVSLRERLDRSFLYIQDRHTRMMRRAREASLESRPANAEAVLQWASDHYALDFERAVFDARKTLNALARANSDERLAADVARLEKQLGRMSVAAQQVKNALDILLYAHISQDPPLIKAAERDLDRADRAMDTLMMVADGMVRGAYSWQAQRVLSPAWAARPLPG